MKKNTSNFYLDIKESIIKYFAFLKSFGFSDFKEKQIAYEIHFETENEFAKIDISFELTSSTPIWITVNGFYVDHIELENVAITQYKTALTENYDELFQKYLKKTNSKYLNQISERYSVIGKSINDQYLKEISKLLKNHSYILKGDLEQLKINSGIVQKKREAQEKEAKIKNGIFTLEFNLWDSDNEGYDFYNEFANIEEINQYLKENSDIKKYRVLDCNIIKMKNELEIKEKIIINGKTPVAFTPYQNFLVSSSKMGLQFWNCENGNLEDSIKINEDIYSIAISPDSKQLALGLSQKLQIIDLVSKSKIYENSNFSENIFSMSYSNDGRELLVGDNEDLKIFATGNYTFESLNFGLDGYIESLAYSNDDNYFAVGQGSIIIVDRFTRKEIVRPLDDLDLHKIVKVKFSPDDKKLFFYYIDNNLIELGMDAGHLCIWAFNNEQWYLQKKIIEYLEHNENIVNFDLSNNGRYLVAFYKNGNVKLLDINNKESEVISKIKYDSESYFNRTSLCFNKDDRFLAISLNDLIELYKLNL